MSKEVDVTNPKGDPENPDLQSLILTGAFYRAAKNMDAQPDTVIRSATAMFLASLIRKHEPQSVEEMKHIYTEYMNRFHFPLIEAKMEDAIEAHKTVMDIEASQEKIVRSGNIGGIIDKLKAQIANDVKNIEKKDGNAE